MLLIMRKNLLCKYFSELLSDVCRGSLDMCNCLNFVEDRTHEVPQFGGFVRFEVVLTVTL